MRMTDNEKQIIDEFESSIYKRGFEDGRRAVVVYDDGYKKGLNDAWEAAVKIVNSPLSDAKIMEELFNTTLPEDVLPNISASEAIAKIKEYEEKHADDEIKLWDEVIIKRSSLGFEGTKGIVINTNPSEFNGLIEVLINYATSHHYKPENLEKTGKSYPELGNILDQLKGDKK